MIDTLILYFSHLRIDERIDWVILHREHLRNVVIIIITIIITVIIIMVTSLCSPVYELVQATRASPVSLSLYTETSREREM